MTKKRIEFIPLHEDLMFKHIFGREDNKEFTIDLISEILCLASDEFIGAEITNSIKLDRKTVKNKGFEIDVVVKTTKGVTYNLEMQNTHNDNSVIKNSMYVMNLFATGLEKGKSYDEAKPVIQICIVSENTLFPDNTDLIEEFVITSKIHKERILLEEEFQIYILDLSVEIDYTKISKKLIGWIKLLKAENEASANELIEYNPWAKKVVKEMVKFMGKDYVQSYAAQEKLIRSNMKWMENKGRDKGRAEGRVEGRNEERLEIVKNMLKNTDMTLEQISTCTSLTLDEITKIKDELEK